MSPHTSERILALGVRRLRIRSFSTASSSCNGVVEFSTCGGAGGPSYRPLAAMTMIENIQAVAFTNSRRSVFQNKKTLPSPHWRNITPDAAETKDRALFSDSNSECFPADLDPPSASQLDRILPSLNQLRDEIPSSEYVEELVRRQGRSTALLKSIFSHLRVVPLHSFTLLDSKPPPNDRGKVPTSKTDHTVKAEMRETVNTYTLPTRLAVRDERRCSEIVLTPSTILERLEIIFPPKRAAEEVKVARAVHNADDISKRGPIPLGTRDSARSHAFITVGRLRACCQPIPWERVQLQRVSTSIQAECGEKKVSDFNSRITGGSNGVPKIFVTPAVYNIFIPPRFLLPDSQMTRRCQTGMARAVMEDGGFLREFGGFRCSDKGWPHRGGIIASRNKSNSTKRHSEKEKKMSNHPVWLQHVAVLHHIPGLTDPGTETLNLKDFASHIRRQQRNGELSCPHCLSHQNSAADTPFRTHKGGDKFLSAADEAEREPRFASSDSVGVGVWIIRPCCESTFFALRFNTGTDHHEWLCKPHTTLWPQTEEGTIGHRTSVADAARDAVAPLLWARQSLCRTLRANFFPQSQAKGALMGSLSTILYYYASGTALTASEKLVVAEQLLETTNMQPQQGSRDHPHTNHLRFLSCRASQRKESRNSKQLQNSGEVQSSDGVLKLAEVWAPLPRSSFLLRGRRVTESPQALAEAMKYGLLRVFW